jgi:hypothetical protein
MRSAALIFSFVFLTSCVASEPFVAAWREGATAAEASGAQTDCMIEAANRVPQQIQSYTTPVYTTPSNVQCNTYGNYVSCQQYGGQVYGGQTQIYDANVRLRDMATAQCLARRGFSVATIPACTTEQTKKGLVSFSSGRLPAASSVLCVVEGAYVLK